MWSAVILAAIVPSGGLLGLAMTGSRAKRGALVAVATCALAIPFFVDEKALWYRSLLVASLFCVWVRLIDLAKERRPLSAVRRLMHATMLVEMRRTERVPRVFHVRSLVRFLVLGTINLSAIYAAMMVPATDDYRWWFVRWLACVIFAYTSLDAFAAYATLQWRALGFAIPVMHDDPIKSRTIAEFWSRRWNRTIGSWLGDHCFRPLARRGHATLGILAAFAATTVLHVYLAFGAFDARAALMWAVFFGLQAPLVFVERAFRVASWPTPLSRLWTIGILLCISPLFVEPILRLTESGHI